MGMWQPGTVAAKQMIPKPTGIYFAHEPATCTTAWGQLVSLLLSIGLKQQQHLFCSRFCNLVSVRWAPFLSVPRGVSWDGSGGWNHGGWNHLKAHCFISGPELGSPWASRGSLGFLLYVVCLCALSSMVALRQPNVSHVSSGI